MASELKRVPVRSIRFDCATRGDAAERTTTRQWYGDPSGSFKTGFWAAQPGKTEIAYTIDELCVLLEGVVRLTDAAGHVEIYRSGDTFLIPNGFTGIWETIEPVRKFYAVFAPRRDT
jgi:uncharacterized cupin superfamily protein